LESSSADVVTAPLSSGVRVDARLVDVVAHRYLAAEPLARLA
jgi:hypothetical protein